MKRLDTGLVEEGDIVKMNDIGGMYLITKVVPLTPTGVIFMWQTLDMDKSGWPFTGAFNGNMRYTIRWTKQYDDSKEEQA